MPKLWNETIDAHRRAVRDATLDATAALMAKHGLDGIKLPKLRQCVAAGEPLNPEIIRSWRAATGITIRDGYGQSEAGLLIANLAGLPERTGSMGLPLNDEISAAGKFRQEGKEYVVQDGDVMNFRFNV